jgi:hypothetical protein
LGERLENNGPCKAGGLNPFYTADYYYELGTAKYWETMDQDEKNRNPAAYDNNAWVAFQCTNLIKYHEEKMAD